MTTTWKKINGYPNHSVSNEGQVRNDKTGTVYKTWLDTNGYPSLHIGKDIKRLHKIVAEAFIENPLNLPEVNHIDGNKTNCHESNLEWCTHAENISHSWKNPDRKQRHENTRVQCVETGEVYKNANAAAKAVGRSPAAMKKCLYGWTKTCAGLQWRYYYDYENGSDTRGEGYDLWICKSRWEEYFGVPEEQSAE